MLPARWRPPGGPRSGEGTENLKSDNVFLSDRLYPLAITRLAEFDAIKRRFVASFGLRLVGANGIDAGTAPGRGGSQ